jgi:hypothetical protein
VVAAVVMYLLFSLILDDFRTPAMNGGAATDVNIGAVLFVSALVSLASWALLAILERFTAKALTIWTVVAIAVLVLSIGGPMSGTGITTGNRLALALIHVVVGTVLIVFMRRATGPASRPS